MGWLIALAVLAGLAFLPLGFRAVYRDETPGVWLLIGPVKFKAYPKVKKTEKNKTKTQQKTGRVSKTPKTTQRGGSFKDFKPVIDAVFEFLKDFRPKIRINHLEMKLVLAGGDPCDLALNYGKGWAILGSVVPILDSLFVIKNKNLEVECDFTSDTTRIYARLDAAITLARVIHLLYCHGIRVLRELLKIKNQRKGGSKS